MKVYTIGFTQKSAKEFFMLLKSSHTKRIIDVRLNNTSQLAGFTKQNDLKYFLKEICDIDYMHAPELAPTPDILKSYRANKKAGWEKFREQFLELMIKRNIEKYFDKTLFDGGCLLCAENQPHYCHRLLVAEYLKTHWHDEKIDIDNLVE